jgi:4a-hydroxytetrahydrobiopterin dehydratase
VSWQNLQTKLQKEFTFPDFVSALEFVNKVGEIAENLGHHPEIYLTWGKVIVTTTTHDAGGTITDKDWELARLIDSDLD